MSYILGNIFGEMLIVLFIDLMFIIPNGIESQPTIEDDFCEDRMLKQENDALRMSLDRMKRQSNGYESSHVTINLIKRLTQTDSYSVPYRVSGVTKHDNKIYVLCYQTNSIRVFEDRTPFHLLNEIPLTQVGYPYGIECNARYNFFYVTDKNNRCIWKITIRNGYQAQATKWLTDIANPYTMSLSSDGHLLVLRDSGDSQSSHLEIYNASDARLIRSIQLPNGIIKPLYAIQSKGERQFIICHTDRENGIWIISRLTSDGQTIILQSKRMSELEMFSDPYFLLEDSDNNRLFVADYKNNRVILLDSNSLDFRKLLLSSARNGVQFPYSLYYDQQKKQLIVGHWRNIQYRDGGVVDVYEIN